MIPNGQMLGKYKIVRQLGAGGMSDVYEAIDTTLERHVALKVLPVEFGQDSEHVQRFRKEVLAVAALDHPGIVTIFEVGSSDEHQFYAMTLLQQGNLKNRLLKSTMPPDEALSLLRALADALGHAHEAGIVHRDIKPENVLFGRDDKPVIVDFGIAKKLTGNTRITAIGTSVGTPFYMSPEQAKASAQLDARSDIYSLGVLLFELLRGTVPYDSASVVGVALQHLNDPIPDLGPEFAFLQPLLNQMMAKNPEDRPQNTAQLIAQIDKLLPQARELSPASEVAPTPPPSKPATKPRDPSEVETKPPQPRDPGPPTVVVAPNQDVPPPPRDPNTEFELMAVTPASNPAMPESPVPSDVVAEPEAAPEAAPEPQVEAEAPESRSAARTPAEKGAGEAPDSEPESMPPSVQESDSASGPTAGAGQRASTPTEPEPATEATSAVPPGPDAAPDESSAANEPPAPAPDPVAPPPAARPATSSGPPGEPLAQTTAAPLLNLEDLQKAPPGPSAPVTDAHEPGRWRSEDLYEKPPTPPLWRRPLPWIALATVAVVITLGLMFGGKDSDEPSPLDLVTSGAEGPQGIGLRAPIRREESLEQAPTGEPVDEAPQNEPAAVLTDNQGDGEAEGVGDKANSAGGDSAAPQLPVEENLDDLLVLELEPSPAESAAGDASAPEERRAPPQAPTEVTQLLLDAALFVATDQLTLPAGENAWEAYQQVLDIDPGNREALRGLAQLQTTYVERAQAALAKGDAAAADAALERLSFIDPNHPELPRLQQQRQQLGSAGDAGGSAQNTFSDPLQSGGRGPQMVALPAGTNSQPRAAVAAFALSSHEITVAQFEQFVSDTGYESPPQGDAGCNYWLFNWRQRSDKSWRSPGFNQSDDHAVVCVSQADARAFANWLSEQTGQAYRLPTELEWIYAARFGGAGLVFWDRARDACDFANVSDVDRADRHNLEKTGENIFGCRDGRVTTAPVGSYRPSPGGFYDLLGNAGEWVADCWSDDGPAVSVPAAATGACESGVVLGGSWFERPAEVDTSVRLRMALENRFSHIGFRIARNL